MMKRKKRPNKKVRMDKTSMIILTFVTLTVLMILAYRFSPIVSHSFSGRTTDVSSREGIPNELVCMVNDAYMGKQQIEVPVNDKMYYGCCEMCVSKLNNIRETRYAKDPYSGEEVDKASAFIVLKNEMNDAVWYFTSEQNYIAYQNQSKVNIK